MFIFRLVTGFIAILTVTILAGAITLAGFAMHKNNAGMVAMIVSLTFISLLTVLPAMIIVGVFFKFTNDFVVPIMFLHDKSALDAWREFWSMLSANKLPFAVYILFQIALAVAIAAIVFAAALTACCLCCCTACLWFVPYINTVVLLPVLVLKLAYSLFYLRQFGPEFDVFAPAVAETIS